MGNSNAARWAARWVQPHNFQSKLDIRSANMDAAQSAHEDLAKAHEGAVYTAYPSGQGVDLRSGMKIVDAGENVRSWNAGDK
jgi:hypothetical protein